LKKEKMLVAMGSRTSYGVKKVVIRKEVDTASI
jgi:hypothetical protein